MFAGVGFFTAKVEFLDFFLDQLFCSNKVEVMDKDYAVLVPCTNTFFTFKREKKKEEKTINFLVYL